ncbi:hypothetical protein [Methylobacterium gnaphalii]|uniref:UrcA family protein n=1 Tax=Methylobacterium gnaphalii TaxID=1010610 RepID=A0A512JLA9_9HYPH|nr:hypothetical protein [Methylobacterium gnaphalii]GEP10737.1 hypothetical protein MGN01_25820 [Methylobacterium gnaphalii]GJD67391.1 hypothetical protein MMMDOFMJ_0306 [Methylobacterium gnaphalii]GLS49277.1 hypothetical protein GCM10007885_21250 [Methylobacterium gnaphalii]
MRSLLSAILAGSTLMASPAFAEEPLFLRIRPNDDEAVAARARALREAVWARSDRRARIAIASVCTGCMKPLAPARSDGAGGPAPDVPATGAIPDPSPVPAGDP